jgi:glutathione S-transferase
MRVTSGAVERQDAKFRGWAELPAAGRYHLYVAMACPWSHRAVIARHLKGLEDDVGISYLDPYRDEGGWTFSGDGYTDAVNGFDYLAEAYEATAPGYDGRVSVPVLWDGESGRIVSNESHDIMRMFNAADPEDDLYPAALREEIDRLNDRIYATVNNGVYRAGFARTQEAYDEAFAELSTRCPPSSGCSPSAATSPATSSPRPTGASSPRSCASTPSTTCTSAATAAGSSTTRTCGPTRASSTSGQGSPRPSRWTRSRRTTTRPTTR